MKKQTRQNKNKNVSESPDTKYKLSLKQKFSFSLQNLFFVFIVGLVFGGLIGYEIARTHVEITESGGSRDIYGRSLGHPHYGHNHP